MAPSIKRLAAVLGTTVALTGGALVATAPAASATDIVGTGSGVVPSPCPPGYYGVAVYDRAGGTIAYACVR